MARVDCTIDLGFVGHVRFQAAGFGPGEKLEQQRDRLQQKQGKVQDQQDVLQEKLVVVNSQINAGVLAELTEGDGNSSVVPTAPATADTGVGSSNSEMDSSDPAVNMADARCAVEQMEAECATPK